MSMLSWATIESRGTVGWRVNQSEPSRPSSSAVCHTNRMERLGRSGDLASASAISSTLTEPLPSSSAPLKTESGLGPRIFRRLSSMRAIVAVCSAVGVPGEFSAPRGRMTVFQARSESWSPGDGARPM